MAGTEGTSKLEGNEKPSSDKNEDKKAPEVKTQSFFLPETGEVVEAETVADAIKKAKKSEENKGE